MERTGSGTRAQAVVNVVAIVLLLSLGVGILFMPRYNYAVIASQVAALETRTAALESGFEKLNILAGPGEEQRAAVLSNLDFIATKVKSVDEDLVRYLEVSTEAAFRLEEALRRVQRLEELPRSSEAPREPTPSGESAAAVMPQVDGGERAKDLSLTPRRLSEMKFEEFLDLALDRGLARSRTAPGENPVSEGLPAEAKTLFDAFRTFIRSINQSENLFVKELVEKATRTGDYVEEDESQSGERRKRIDAPSKAGTVFVQNLGGGKRRVFHLSAEEHPEFAHFENLRDRALQSFLVSLSTLPKR